MNDDGFKDEFSSVAAAYARFRPTYPDALFAFLASLSSERTIAWDCATGSGQSARALASYFSTVLASDASREQIRHAAPRPGVSYLVARAEQVAIASGAVDLVTVSQALHWLDVPAFHAEARRVGRDSALIAVWCYGRLRFGDDRLDAIIEELAYRALASYWPPERHHIDTAYRDIPFPFPEIPAPSFSMQVAFTLSRFAGYVGTWSAVRRYRRTHGNDPVQPLVDRLVPLWGDHDLSRSATFPLALRVGRLHG